MRSLDIDLSTRPAVATWFCVAIALGGSGMAAWWGWSAWQLGHEVTRATVRANKASALLQATRQRAAPPAIAASDAPFAQDAFQIAERASFDAGRILATLESPRVLGARVVVIEVSAVDRSARVELEFVDATALHGYLDDINAGEPTRRWNLTRVSGAPNSGEMGRAAIEAQWGTVGTVGRK